jgi:hypothetical protein
MWGMKRKVFALAGVCLGLYLCVCVAAAVGQGRITKAKLGTELTSTAEVNNRTTEFSPDTPNIYCVWATEGLDDATSVRGVWIAEDVGHAAAPNYEIGEATLHPPAHSGNFALSKPDAGFPVGKYRIEIYLGADLAKTVAFTVKAK